MKTFKVAAMALVMPLFLTACPGKKQEAPAPTATESMVPNTPPAETAPAAPADPNAAPANPAATEGGTTNK